MRKRGIVDEVYSSSLTRAESRRATSNPRGAYVRLDIFERVEVGERGGAARHIEAVTLLARIRLRAPFKGVRMY